MPTLEGNQQFERYCITRWLGNSVSGESYEAVDTKLQRKVTLKLIHPWSTQPDSARRQFFREMQGIGMLNHPYMAPVFDYGEIDGKLYVVRCYLDNGSLLNNEGRMWFKPPLHVDEALYYTYQLAQALEYIHHHGYLHGALTFSNVMVLRGPNIDHEPDYAPFLLADVGLANYVRQCGQPLTQLQPLTSAPEQLRKQITPASDQFALAVLLYFWLADRPPYLGSPEEIEHAKLTETYPSLSSLNAHVTLEQEEVIRRALSVYPEERYPSVLAFAEALRATLAPLFKVTPDSPVEEEEVLEEETRPSTTAYLLIRDVSGGDSSEYKLEREETQIGRAGSDDVLLDQDSSISRHHALLKYEDDRYLIYDQRSNSGVFVSGEKLNNDAGRLLTDGDHIHIGNYELIFRCSRAGLPQQEENNATQNSATDTEMGVSS